MSTSEPFQIEIPSFDEDEDLSNVITPMPHGHTRPYFDPDSRIPSTGGFQAPPSAGGADDSPSGPSQHFINRHARGNSTSSETSIMSSSLRSNKPSFSRGPGGHSSSNSVATTATTATSHTVVKKSSFGALRAAMKSVRAFAEAADRVPPVPSLNVHREKSAEGKDTYPELRNPFAKPSSTPARAQSPALSMKSNKKRPTLSTSRSRPSQQSTSHTTTTSASASTSSTRNPSSASNWGLTHSAASSWAYDSDFSDMGREVPPVPKLPRSVAGPRVQTVGVDEAVGLGAAVVENEPKTPGELALHVVFTQFVAKVEEKIRKVLDLNLDKDPSVASVFGAKVDPSLDALFVSLGHIAQRHANSVIEALMRWRKTQREAVAQEQVEKVLSTSAKIRTYPEARQILNHRKHLASIYVFSRALLVLIRTMGKDSMGEALAIHLENTIFNEYRDLDPRALAQSSNWKSVAALYAEVLGAMADTRFQSVTDHFLDAFGTLGNEQGQPETDQRYDHLLKGLKHIKIKVWPPEAFEEGAEFMDAFAGHFANVHGFTVKSAFAEALTAMMHPIRKTAGAEVNHPLWSKAMQSIYPRAFAMIAKPRYWQSAFPLTITSVCLAPTEYFLKHWMPCFDLCTAKLKDKAVRVFALNGISRLLWTYLYRGNEPASTTLRALEGCIKSITPPNRPLQLTPEEPLDLFVYIIQLTCSRHFEFGRDLIMDFLNDPSITGTAQTGSTSLPAPEKMTIALRSSISALRGMESDTPPAWPVTSDFSLWVITEELPAWSGVLSEQTLAKPGIRDFVDRLSPLIMKITTACGRLVGGMYISDDSFSYSRQAPSYEERENLVVRQNGSRMVAYRKDLAPHMDLLRACYETLPTLWHRNTKLSSTIGRLVDAVAHVNPLIGQAASEALQRFASTPGDDTSVVLHVTRWLFASEAILQSDPVVDLMCEHQPMLELWLLLVTTWAERTLSAVQNSLDEVPSPKPDGSSQLIGQVDAGCLFLICSAKLQVRDLALKVLRIIASMPDKYQPDTALHSGPFRLIDALQGTIGQAEYLRESDRSLTLVDQDRLNKWLGGGQQRNLVKLLQDDNADRFLWRIVFPPFLRVCLEKRPYLVSSFRATLAAAVTRTHPVVSSHAGISTKTAMATMKSPFGQVSLNESAQASVQWVSWVLALSSTAIPTDTGTSPRDHARHGSEPIPLQERILTNRGLIRLLLPYLDADTRTLREGTVYALGCVHPKSLHAVLEDAGSVVRNVHIEAYAALSQKRSMQRSRDQDRLHTSVMHVFQLTSDWAKRLEGSEQILELMITFYRGSLAFFRDAVARQDHELLSLQKHFCGLIEQLFDIWYGGNLSTKPDPDSLVRMYIWCKDWCDFVYPSQHSDAHLVRARSESATRAIAAITSHSALFDLSPTLNKGLPNLTPPTYADVFRWIERTLPLNSLTARNSAKTALENICRHSMLREDMTSTLITFCLPSSRDPAVAAIFFDIVSDRLLDNPKLLPTSRLLFLCLSNLTHPDISCRRKSLGCLEILLRDCEHPITLSAFRSAVEVVPEGSHVQAQRAVAGTVASALPELSMAFLAECASRFSQGYSDGGNSMLIILEPWMEHIDLTVQENGDKATPTRAVMHLIAISAVHLLANFAIEVRALWQRLTCGRFPANYRAMLDICATHALRCGREDFIRIVQAGISALSMTPIAVDAFNFLCARITVQTIALTKLEEPLEITTDTESELDGLFPPSDDTVKMSSGQVSCLFLSDLALTDASEVASQLPLLLHALLNLVDHEQALVRIDAHMLLLRILRLCTLRETGLSDTRGRLQDIEELLRRDTAHFAWVSADRISRPDGRVLITTLCEDIIKLLDPTLPTLRHDWSVVALEWSISTSKRHVALRSLQILCILRFDLNYYNLEQLLGRLSNIVSDHVDQGNEVSGELIKDLTTLASSVTINQLLNYPELLWTGIACLTSTVKQEFRYGVEMLDSLFRVLETAELDGLFACLAARPESWTGPDLSLFQLLSPGLRSSFTSDVTFLLFDRLASNPEWPFFEGDDLHSVIAVSMPRFLESMAKGPEGDQQIKTYALKLSVIAERFEWPGVVRVLTSFAKDRFRTKEDFIRQMIGCLRERIPGGGWLETITLLLGLVFNSGKEIRVNTMALLKQLFSMPDIRGQLKLFGSEHLTPLLRLLGTDLASEALEVLDEPMSVAGGLPARQVVRMSLINGPSLRKQEDRPSGVIFGVPDDSGWCVPQPDSARMTCAQNIHALYDICAHKYIEIARLSGVDLDRQDNLNDPARYGRPESVSGYNDEGEEASFGDLVTTLHDLSNYFEEELDGDDTLPSSSSMNSMHDAESRVAAILSQSLHPSRSDKTPTAPLNGNEPYRGQLGDPPTPFLGLFSMASPMDPGPSDFDQAQHETEIEGYFAGLPRGRLGHQASFSWDSDPPAESDMDAASVFGVDDGQEYLSHYYTSRE